MANDLQRLIGGEFGIRLAGLLGWMLPPRLGYALADFIADRLASNRNSAMVRALRANQRVVRGEALEAEVLDQAVREVLRQSARSIFDLYRSLHRTQSAQESIVLDEASRRLIQRPEFDDRGLVVASLHLGNFDLILHSLTMQGMKSMVLTIPDPQGGRRKEYEMRKKNGVNLVPSTVGGFLKAVRHLQQGGFVATGIDRPIPQPKIRPRFFGRPASLPLHHIFLALKAKVPVMVIATIRRPDGTNEVFSSDTMEMDPFPDKEMEVRRNAEKVLGVAEEYIRLAPQQWSVSLPVWPEAADGISQ